MSTTERSVLDGHDHTACANKVRKIGYDAPNGYDEYGSMTFKWIENRSTTDCKYDRRMIDPACAAAKCSRISHEAT